MEYCYLSVHIILTQGDIQGMHEYYYKLPVYESPEVAMTEQRAKDLFLLDPERHLHLLADLPTEGCTNYVAMGDLRIPVPNPHPEPVSVLRVDHLVRAGQNFEILAELQNWTIGDKAYVEIIGLAGVLGRNPMSAFNQELPVGSGTMYSWRKVFPALAAGASISYRVYANSQSAYLEDTIHVDNDDQSRGPVWGGWLPKIVQLGTFYAETLPADAATGTGTVGYQLLSGPTWYNFASNTRNIGGDAPGSQPATDQTVTYRAYDSNGSTDKTFTLQFGSVLDMVAGWGFENIPGGSRLYFGIGPNDDLPYTVKLTQRVGSNFSDTSTHTAERIGVGLDGVSYPWRCVYNDVPIGTYVAEITRSNGQKRYALIEFTGRQYSWTLTLLSTPPTTSTNPDNPGGTTATIDGDDIWTNTGSNDGSLNDNVAPVERTRLRLDADGPTQCPEGESIQLRCLVTYSDGSVVNVTSVAEAHLPATGGVGISASGVLTAQTNATTGDTHTVRVTFTYYELTAYLDVQVIDRSSVPVTLSSIDWQGPDSINKPSNTQYRVIAKYSDNSTADVTSTASIGSGVTGATMQQDGILRVAADASLTETLLNATYQGKQARKTVTINGAPLVIQYVDVEVKNSKLFHYVKTNPSSRTQGAAPVQQIYYRIRTNVAGGSLPTAYGAWSANNVLFDHTDAGLGELQNTNLKNSGFNHFLYGSYFGASYSAFTVYLQLSLSPTGAAAIEVSYTVPASSAQPTVPVLQIYPFTN